PVFLTTVDKTHDRLERHVSVDHDEPIHHMIHRVNQVDSIISLQMIKYAAAYNGVEATIRLDRDISHVILTELQVAQPKSLFAEYGLLDVSLSNFDAERIRPFFCEFDGENAIQTSQVKDAGLG